MRILCFSIDLPGHLDWGGYLQTAAELSRRGHDVLWVSGPAVKAPVRQAGVNFAPVPVTGWQHAPPPLSPQLSPQEREHERRVRALTVWLNPSLVLQAVAELQKIAAEFHPHIILSEPFAAAGVLLAEKMELPLVVVGRPAQPPPQPNPRRLPNPATPYVEQLIDSAGLTGKYWDLDRGSPRSPYLHLDFFNREWYADLPHISPQTTFCGGTPASQRPLDIQVDARPLVFITLGSTFANDERFFRIAAESALLNVARPVIATGKRVPKILASLKEAPPGPAIVRDWIDYSQIFPHLAGIVHHGGMATTHAALVHGIPQVIIPHAGDQYPQAARVTQAQVGYGIRTRDFTMENAPLILTDIIWGEEFRARAQEMALSLNELGGPTRAARAVESL